MSITFTLKRNFGIPFFNSTFEIFYMKLQFLRYTPKVDNFLIPIQIQCEPDLVNFHIF